MAYVSDPLRMHSRCPRIRPVAALTAVLSEGVGQQAPQGEVEDLSTPPPVRSSVRDQGSLVCRVDRLAVIAKSVQHLEVRVGFGEESQLIRSTVSSLTELRVRADPSYEWVPWTGDGDTQCEAPTLLASLIPTHLFSYEWLR